MTSSVDHSSPSRLGPWLSELAKANSNQIAVVDGDRRVSYGTLLDQAERLAEYLRGLQLPDYSRVGLLCANSPEYVAAFLAIAMADLVIVPLDTSLTADGLVANLADCQVRVLITQARFRKILPALPLDRLCIQLAIIDHPLASFGARQTTLTEILAGSTPEPLPQQETPEYSEFRIERNGVEHELAAIFYTSGSTGASKGVMLSHRNLISNTIATVEYLKLTEVDRIMVILPFYYIYGNSLLLTHLAVGGTLVLDNRFLYPEVILDTMQAERVTGFSGVPSNFNILLGNSTLTTRDFPHLRYFTQAGGAMAPEVTRRLLDAFPAKEIYIMYGQTEAAPRVSWLPPHRLAEKLGSCGIPVPGVTISIRDDNDRELPHGEVGELVVEGDNVMMGYWNQPEETDLVLRDGRLYTGDLARRDADGFFFIVGRKKEIIKAGGNRVSAKEVEECLLAHPQVLEAVVVGVPDKILGEAIKAVIVPKAGQVPEAREIINYCKRSLADFKVPKTVQFVQQLPKYQSGKVNKLALRDQV